MKNTKSSFVLSLLVFICILYSVKGNLFKSFSSQPKNEKKKRSLLPKLVPHKDDSYMLEFIADGSDHCEQMEPVVRRLEEDLGIKVRRININRRHEFAQLFETCGGNECGNLPFFYNRKTAQAICGATPYKNLKNLSMGSAQHLFMEAPQNIFEKSDYNPRKQRDVGVKDYISRKMMRRGFKGRQSQSKVRGQMKAEEEKENENKNADM